MRNDRETARAVARLVKAFARRDDAAVAEQLDRITPGGTGTDILLLALADIAARAPRDAVRLYGRRCEPMELSEGLPSDDPQHVSFRLVALLANDTEAEVRDAHRVAQAVAARGQEYADGVTGFLLHMVVDPSWNVTPMTFGMN